MGFFLDDPDKNNAGWHGVQSDAPALGAPQTTYGDVARATAESYDYAGSVAAKHTALFDAYDDQIKAFEDHGVKNHGLRNPLALYSADRSVGVPDAAERFERRKFEFSQQLRTLADKYPELAAKDPQETMEERGRAISLRAIQDAARATEHGPPGSGILAFGVGAGKGLIDPFNSPFLALGGARQGGSLAYHFAHSAATNALMTAAQQPAIQSYNAELGLPSGWAEAAKEIAIAGLIGGGIDVGVRGAARVGRVARGLPAVKAGPEFDASTPGLRGIFEGGRDLPSREQFATALHEAVKTLPEGDPIRMAAEGNDKPLADHLYDVRSKITDPEIRGEIDKAIADADVIRAMKAAGIHDDWSALEAMGQVFKHFDDPHQPLPRVSQSRKPSETFSDHIQAQLERLTDDAARYAAEHGIPPRTAALVAELVPKENQFLTVLEAIKESGALAAHDVRRVIASVIENPAEAGRSLVHGGNADHMANLEHLLETIRQDSRAFGGDVVVSKLLSAEVFKALHDPSTEASRILARAVREKKPESFPERLAQAIEQDGKAAVLERQDKPLGRPEFDDPVKAGQRQIEDIEPPALRAMNEMAHKSRLSSQGREPAQSIDWSTVPGAIEPKDMPAVVDMWSFVDAMRRKKEPQSIVDFIRDRGGMRDDGGDLRTTLGEYNKRPGLVSHSGMKMDDIAHLAWEAGFLEGTERPDINALLDAVSEELHGRKVYRVTDRSYADDVAVARQMEADLAELGVRDAKSRDDVERAIRDINAQAARDAGVGGSAEGIGRSLEDTFATASEFRSVEDLRASIAAGRPYQVPTHVIDAVLHGADDVLRTIPEGHGGGTLYRVDPVLDHPGDVQLTFISRDGRQHAFVFPLDFIFPEGNVIRALTFRPDGAGRFIGFLSLSDSGERGIVGIHAVARHELVHVLRSGGFLPDGDFFALVRHAEALQVLDMPLVQFHEAIGIHPTDDPRTLRDVYTAMYGKRPDVDEFMAQEAVAHFVELADHGYWLRDEIEPVRHLLDGITSGRYAGKESWSHQTEIAQDRAVGRSMRADYEAAIAGKRSDQDALGFYSALDRVLSQLKPTDTVTAQTLAQRGVKQSELQARGLDQILASGGAKVSDLRAAVKEPVGLREAFYSGNPPNTGRLDAEFRSALNNLRPEDAHLRPELEAAIRQPLGRGVETYNGLSEAAKDALERYSIGSVPNDAAGPSKWSSYSLDRGSNPTYRESVLHLPDTQGTVEQWKVTNPAFGHSRTYADEASARAAATGDDIVRRAEPVVVNNGFRSGHWSEPNAIAHMRTSLQRDAQGRPVFHVDELQSDWGQKIRDQGGTRALTADEITAKRADLKRQIAGIEPQYQALMKRENQRSRSAGNGLIGNDHDLEDALKSYGTAQDRNVQAEYNRLQAELYNLSEPHVPGHPLVNTSDQWQTTAARRALRQAVDADAHGIALPSGDTVLGYGMGGEPEGMRYAYDKMYPAVFARVLKKLDPTIERQSITLQGHEDKGPFIYFPITDKVRQAVRDEGQPMFAVRGKSDLEKAQRDLHIQQHGARPLVTPEEADALQHGQVHGRPASAARSGGHPDQAGEHAAAGTGTGQAAGGGESGKGDGGNPNRAQDFPIAGYRGRRIDTVGADGHRRRDYFAFPSEKTLPSKLSPKAELKFLLQTNPWVARASLVERWPGAWEIEGWSVRKNLREAGLGTHFFKSFEAENGGPIAPSGMLTEEGYGFRKKLNPESVKWHRKVGSMWLSPKQLINIKLIINDIAENATSHEELQHAIRQNEQVNRGLASLPEEAVTPEALDAMFAVRGKGAGDKKTTYDVWREAADEHQATEDWRDAHWQDLARRGYAIDRAIEQREAPRVRQAYEPKSALEKEADRILQEAGSSDLAGSRTYWQTKRGEETLRKALDMRRNGHSLAEVAKFASEELGRDVTEGAVLNQLRLRRMAIYKKHDLDNYNLQIAVAETIWGTAEGKSAKEIAKLATAATGKDVSPEVVLRLQRAVRQARHALWEDVPDPELREGATRPWSRAVFDDLMSLAATGDLSFEKIAQQLNATHGTFLTRNAVAGKLNRVKMRAIVDDIPPERPSQSNNPQYAVRGEFKYDDTGRGPEEDAGRVLSELRLDIERSRANEIAATILNLCKAA